VSPDSDSCGALRANLKKPRDVGRGYPQSLSDILNDVLNNVCRAQVVTVKNGTRKRLLITLALIVAMALFLAYAKVYVVRSGTDGTLYWNEDQALSFIQVGTSGVRMSYARYALEPFLVSLGDVRPPDDHRCVESFVLQITGKDFQRYETPATALNSTFFIKVVFTQVFRPNVSFSDGTASALSP
jgi:hypothetical protein